MLHMAAMDQLLYMQFTGHVPQPNHGYYVKDVPGFVTPYDSYHMTNFMCHYSKNPCCLNCYYAKEEKYNPAYSQKNPSSYIQHTGTCDNQYIPWEDSNLLAYQYTTKNVYGLSHCQDHQQFPPLSDHQNTETHHITFTRPSAFQPYIPCQLTKKDKKETVTEHHILKNHTDHNNVTELLDAMQINPCNNQPRVPLPQLCETIFTDDQLRARLTTRDANELIHLHKLYAEAFVDFPVPKNTNIYDINKLWQLYECFVERQSLFYTKLPMFKLLAKSDRAQLLGTAVATSTHITAAQLMDREEYAWPRKNTVFTTTGTKVLSATTIRQIVSSEHFSLLMTFYMHHAQLFTDPKVALLIQVLSLFCHEPGLSEPHPIRSAHQHYYGLLSRYLMSVHGKQKGYDILQALLNCQEEAKQLSHIHQHVQLSPQVGEYNTHDATDSHAENFQKVCISAHNAFKADKKQKHRQVLTQAAFTDAKEYSIHNDLNTFHSLMTRLAKCDHPETLTTARQQIPPELLQRFLYLIQ